MVILYDVINIAAKLLYLKSEFRYMFGSFSFSIKNVKAQLVILQKQIQRKTGKVSFCNSIWGNLAHYHTRISMVLNSIAFVAGSPRHPTCSKVWEVNYPKTQSTARVKTQKKSSKG